MKKVLMMIMVVGVGMTCPQTGRAGIIPHDLPTIEALISQHKKNMSAEDASNQQLAANASIKAMVKEVAKKYDEVKTILDKKSNDALSYIALAGEMSQCVTNTVRLTREYREFSNFAAKHTKGKPMIAWYTFEANYKVYKELKNINKLYLAVAATETGFFRATNKERQQAYMWCDLMVGGYVQEEHIWDILKSETLQEIGEKVKKEWPI